MKKLITNVKNFVKTLINFFRSLFTKVTEETIFSVSEPQIQKSSEDREVLGSSKRGGLVGRTFKCKKGRKGYQWTDEQRELQRLRQKGSEHKNYGRAVYQCDKDINLIHTFRSIATAARSTKIDYSSIHKCCSGKTQTAGGYVFMYV